jgi:hypothetical protein
MATRTLFKGLGVGYGSGGAAGAATSLVCGCMVAPVLVFWLGGAAVSLGALLVLARAEV